MKNIRLFAFDSVYLPDFGFEKVDNYLDFPKIMKKYTEE